MQRRLFPRDIGYSGPATPMSLKPIPIRLFVVTLQGRPLAGQQVFIEGKSQRSDAHGEIASRGVPYSYGWCPVVQVRARAWVLKDVVLATPKAILEHKEPHYRLVIARRNEVATLQGRVFSVRGEGLRLISVALHQVGKSEGVPVATTGTDGAGRFVFPAVTPGRYQVRIGNKKMAPLWLPGIITLHAGQTLGQRFTVPESGSLPVKRGSFPAKHSRGG